MTPDDHGAHPASPLGEAAPTEPLEVPSRRVIAIGSAVWSVALVVILVVPELHTGDRSWWPWTCVTALALGAFAWWYVGRGTSGRDRV